ncbi:MAG: 1-aminocyclopropane-1-carboxylate deaminase/D-cysteine desulfhydrase [Proteobacteria bacterium]|nr:1-aminocyclopropane-1-carboxylate deaminase/D-cysteine desulfhydrase [Pseudomonadota bacterium]
MKPKIPSPLEKLDSSLLPNSDVEVWIKRDDLIHPQVSGNKWRKLKYNIQALAPDAHVLTFGGAYSNHVRAVAAASKLCGFEATAIIRGELVEPLNSVLAYATAQGMKLLPVSREDYRKRHDVSWAEVQRRYTGATDVWPEGGSNALAIKGVKEILHELDQPFDVVCAPVGTGGTLAGLIAGASAGTSVLGVSVLKGGEFLLDDVRGLLADSGDRECSTWSIELDYHFGGYAKSTVELREWIAHFSARSGIPLEPVYSGKLFFAVYDMIAKGRFSPDSKVLIIHTGGVYW